MPTVRSLRDGTIKIEDGAATPLSVTVDVEEGDLSFTERIPANIIMDRGVIDNARKANDEPLELSWSMRFQSFLQHANSTPYEILRQVGDAASATSTLSGSDVYAVKVTFTLADVDSVFSGVETLTFDDFIPEEVSFAEGDPNNTLTVSGRMVAVSPTIA